MKTSQLSSPCCTSKLTLRSSETNSGNTMSTPPEEITIACPDCGHVYKDWYRASINLALDDFGADYLEQASTTTCPVCRVTHDLGTLVVRRDSDGNTIFEM